MILEIECYKFDVLENFINIHSVRLLSKYISLLKYNKNNFIFILDIVRINLKFMREEKK